MKALDFLKQKEVSFQEFCDNLEMRRDWWVIARKIKYAVMAFKINFVLIALQEKIP